MIVTLRAGFDVHATYMVFESASEQRLQQLISQLLYEISMRFAKRSRLRALQRGDKARVSVRLVLCKLFCNAGYFPIHLEFETTWEEERLLVEMLCKWCGKETPDDSAFCESCGKAISEEATSEGAEALSDAGADASPDDVDEEQASAVEGESSDAAAEQQESALEEKLQAVLSEEAPNDAEEVAAEEILDAYEPWLSFGSPACSPVEFAAEESAASIPAAIRRSKRDEPLVDPPTPPYQPKLGVSRIVIVATVAVLFAAALILLTCVILMRVMGL